MNPAHNQPARMIMTMKGSCLCGGVEFGFEDDNPPMQYCHATRCRKATGSAFSPETAVRKDEFRWIKGEELITHFEAPVLNEPPAYKRAFCERCGSPLPVQLGEANYMLINPGTLDTDLAAKPMRHAFTGQKACWYEITDGLPTFEGQPPVPGDYQPDGSGNG